MTSTSNVSVAVACVPAAIPAAARSAHFALAHRLFGEVAKERNDLPNGYAFRFDPADLEGVCRFVENERRCCPFMTFEVQIFPASGPLWLRMTGPDGTREVLDAELSLSRACGCGS